MATICKKSYCCKAELYYELWHCDKNPEGRTDIEFTKNYDHGNSIDDCTTCEDDYCSPQITVIWEKPTDEFIKTHEIHTRCSKCDGQDEGE